MIRSGIEYRNAKKQIEDLRSELNGFTFAEPDEVLRGVINALEMKISDIERELDEYENLKEGRVSEFGAKSLDELGEVVTKARIARGWNQTVLASVLEMESPQIQRYEKNDWQKISVWRLQEVIEALDLELDIRARLREQTGPGALWPRLTSGLSLNIATYDDSALTVGKKEGDATKGLPEVVSTQNLGESPHIHMAA